MAGKNGIQKLLLQELQEIKADVKAVRLADIPNMRVDIAKFNEKIKAVERRQTWYSSVATVVGGGLAIAISKFTGNH